MSLNRSAALIAIVGPTGTGKSEAALSFARRVPSEILCVDSMQVYRGMDVGTGKPDDTIRREIPHHGVDLVEPEEEFNVARYLEMVRPAIGAIQERNRFPLLVGGSGLYFRALRRGLAPAPGEDPFLRRQLLAQAQHEGSEILYGRLKEVDPASSRRIHPNDLRRIIRALEVFFSTGKPLTVWHRETTFHPNTKEETYFFGLRRRREGLYERIESRIERWLAQGWLEEVRRLAQRNLSQTAREALGYRELLAYLRGEEEWETTIRLIQRNSRWYAKRQETWFRKEPNIRWIDVDEKEPEDVAQMILNCLPPETGRIH